MILLKNSCLALMLGMACLGAQAAAADREWLQLLDASSPPALQTEWGMRYEHGEGVPRDYVRAVRLYCAAARQGHAEAQYRLGWLYAHGRGGLRDDALAAAWFRLADAQGDTHAQGMLALLGNPEPVTEPVCIIPDEPESNVLSGGESVTGRRQIEAWVHRLAPGYDLDPQLVLAVIAAESAFNPKALSPKNAQGLMQLIPETAQRFGVRDSLDPLQNLHGGMAYLRWLLAFFDGDVKLALAGYNAGERAVERYRGIPPFAETQAYVARIIKSYGYTTHPAVTGVVEPSSMLITMDASQLQQR